MSKVLPATGEVQEVQASGSCLQSLWQDPEDKIEHWRTEEKASKNSEALSSEKNGQSVKLEAQEPSMKQPVIYQHSLSDPSVHLYSGNSNQFSSRASETSKKLSSKKLPLTTNVAAKGDQSVHQTDPSENDTMESDSEIQESIHSMSSL